MKAKIIADEDALSRCAWCGMEIDEEAEVYGFGASLRQDVDLSEYEGQVIELKIITRERTCPMMVAARGSDAKENGHDVMFMTCSNECGREMREVMLEEKSIGDILEGINLSNN